MLFCDVFIVADGTSALHFDASAQERHLDVSGQGWGSLQNVFECHHSCCSTVLCHGKRSFEGAGKLPMDAVGEFFNVFSNLFLVGSLALSNTLNRIRRRGGRGGAGGYTRGQRVVWDEHGTSASFWILYRLLV